VEQHANSVHIEPLRSSGGLSLVNLRHYRYADAYLWLILNRIFAGLKNVRFTAGERWDTNDRVKELTKWLDVAAPLAVWLWWHYGVAAVTFDAHNLPHLIGKDGLKFDRDGLVVGAKCAVYSPQYIFERRSHFAIVAENIANLDRLKNAEDYLTTSLGALGIISGKGAPIYKEDKDQFNKDLKKDYGITSDKYQILLFDSDVNFQQLNLPIKDLALSDKIKEEIKLLAGFFNVPYDLIPFAGASTYANQAEAVRQFYSTCISPLAEVVLQLGREIILNTHNFLMPADYLTFTIDNVPELADDRTAEIEYKLKVADLIKRMKEAGLDTTKYEEDL
jgi:hypothetical protein